MWRIFHRLLRYLHFFLYDTQDAQLPDLDTHSNQPRSRGNLFSYFVTDDDRLVHGEETPIRIWLIPYSLSLHRLLHKSQLLATISGEI